MGKIIPHIAGPLGAAAWFITAGWFVWNLPGWIGGAVAGAVCFITGCR